MTWKESQMPCWRLIKETRYLSKNFMRRRALRNFDSGKLASSWLNRPSEEPIRSSFLRHSSLSTWMCMRQQGLKSSSMRLGEVEFSRLSKAFWRLKVRPTSLDYLESGDKRPSVWREWPRNKWNKEKWIIKRSQTHTKELSQTLSYSKLNPSSLVLLVSSLLVSSDWLLEVLILQMKPLRSVQSFQKVLFHRVSFILISCILVPNWHRVSSNLGSDFDSSDVVSVLELISNDGQKEVFP